MDAESRRTPDRDDVAHDDQAQTVSKHGSTLAETSMSEEAQPRNKAQDVHQLSDKLRSESSREGGGIIGWVKALFHHADREVAGEYERREDPDAPVNPDATMPEQQPPRTR